MTRCLPIKQHLLKLLELHAQVLRCSLNKARKELHGTNKNVHFEYIRDKPVNDPREGESLNELCSRYIQQERIIIVSYFCPQSCSIRQPVLVLTNTSSIHCMANGTLKNKENGRLGGLHRRPYYKRKDVMPM